jgi:cytochrome c biogenesis protein CcmG/thiol:disulfide interchange protein DsbE
MSRTGTKARPAKQGRSRGLLMPLLLFAGLSGLFLIALFTGDPSKLPSALIGKPVPKFTLPPVEGLQRGAKPVPGFDAADLGRGRVSLINVWASWCGPCHQEHPFLTALAKRGGFDLYGLNYKDEAVAARRFLGRYGNPFVAVGQDLNGRVAIDWGVYGVPETFVVDGAGTIVYKHVGPIDDKVIEQRLLPAIARAAEATKPAGGPD